MKRSHAEVYSPAGASADTPAAKRAPSKRAKSSQACSSCRKHKTRCELLDSGSFVSRCHRCEVLSLSCSFETSAPPRNVPLDNSPMARFRREFTAQALLPPTVDTSPDFDSNSNSTYSPWDFVKIAGLHDWTATPVLAMQMLSRAACPDVPASLYPRSPFTMADILTAEQKLYLLNFFELHYSPWLSLPPQALGDDPILDLVRCTIACRHLDPLLRSRVSPALRKLTEEAIMKHVFNPAPSIAVIEAFSMLALWSPFDNAATSTDSHDSRLIVATAVTMCTTLGYNAAADDEMAFEARQRQGEELSTEEMAMYATAEQRHSIWLSVHNVEAMACIGTGRDVSSRVLDFDIKRIGLMSYSTLHGARKTRMAICARLFDLTERGLHLYMSDDAAEYDNYYEDIGEVLYRFDGLLRLIFPLPVAADHEPFYFAMVLVYYHFCRLTFLVHTLRHLRKHVPPTLSTLDGGFFFAKLRRSGCSFALSCARDALLCAESLLTSVLSVHDKDMLATAPDNVFSMISFAAAFIMASKFMLLQSQGLRSLPGSSDQLLRRIVVRLNQIGLSGDHHAGRAATVISGFMGNWEKRLSAWDKAKERAKAKANGTSNGVPALDPLPAVSQQPKPINSSESTSPETLPSETGISSVPPNTPPNSQPFETFDFQQPLDQDTLFGLEFWQYFTEMPTQMAPACT
ncbi:hypothetical protein FA95DRAFT_1579274 [Auriscalpium vulgare]|uniref:Uncharacterized protein n=1 Tax=Auriscalpium vulgare TaxID=40419 RepID=A0ACB8SAZ6_9AGAM|nr:hypothetical protein FA95DRAFT_1579274 [Auriscalpium vulgare]